MARWSRPAAGRNHPVRKYALAFLGHMLYIQPVAAQRGCDSQQEDNKRVGVEIGHTVVSYFKVRK
jgi:hypothetical protein